MPRAFSIGSIMFGVMLMGCGHNQRSTHNPGQVPGPKITEVNIQGRGELRESEILEYLNLRPSEFLGDTYYYLHGSEKIARQKIIELYQANGYYEVRVDPIDVIIKRQDRPLKRQRAEISIQIHPGPPTTISNIRWTRSKQSAKAETAKHRSTAKPGMQVLRERSGLSVGQRFSVEALNQAKQQLVSAMQSRGYSDAQVQESALVNRDTRQAQVAFDLDDGPLVTISSIQIQGLQGTAKRFAHKIAAKYIGTLYAPEKLADIEKQIYALGIAASVQSKLVPGRRPNLREIEVLVSPKDPSQLSLGLSTHVDAAVWSQRVGLRYAHKNLAQRLLQLKTSVSGGWALLPLSDGTWHNSPLLEGDIELSKPTLLKHHTRLFAQAHTLAQPREGYDIWRIDGKTGITQSYAEHASLALSYNLSWLMIHAFLSQRASQAQAMQLYSGERPFLSYLEAQAQYFFLDRRINPRQGVHALLTYQLASRILGSQSEYQRISPELRSYWNPISWLVVATRARVGFILPFGKRPGARFDQRFYLGGVSSIRGWPLRSLSPFVPLCDDQQSCIDTPYGGNSEFLANLELRFNVWKALDLITFLDAADVRNEIFSVQPKGWMYTTGGGLRYSTPIGAIRLDAGYQLNHDLKRFRKTPPFSVHLALGDSF